MYINYEQYSVTGASIFAVVAAKCVLYALRGSRAVVTSGLFGIERWDWLTTGCVFASIWSPWVCFSMSVSIYTIDNIRIGKEL
jgi:hypothetical protein